MRDGPKIFCALGTGPLITTREQAYSGPVGLSRLGPWHERSMAFRTIRFHQRRETYARYFLAED